MRVRELLVSNFRGFGGGHVFHLSEQVTVIAGVNGKGKTSLLDGLALALSRLLRSLAISAGNQRTIATSDVYGDMDCAEIGLKANCAGIPVEFSVKLRSDSRNVIATRLPPALRQQVRQNYGDPTRSDDQTPVVVYYTTDRAGLRLPRTLPPTLPTGQQLAHVGALSNRMVDYRELMARVHMWRISGSRELGAFETAIRLFLDGFSRVEVEIDPLRLWVSKGTQRLNVSQLSDGERSLIAILGDLVRRLALANPELDDPLQGHGVVLLDEMELHLHPKWQRELVEKLRATFPNIQFIGTTHSPFVIQSLQPGELINLDPEDAEYSDRSIEDIAEGVMGVDLPQKSTRYLRMVEAATQYYAALQEASGATDAATLNQLKATLDELALPFSQDPAYQAFLLFQRNLVMGENA